LTAIRIASPRLVRIEIGLGASFGKISCLDLDVTCAKKPRNGAKLGACLCPEHFRFHAWQDNLAGEGGDKE
jgi:hypothetical protein